MINKTTCRTEDQVRDSAKIILGFDVVEAKTQQGTGQITTFNQLGFKGGAPDFSYMEEYMKNRKIAVSEAIRHLSKN
ncbi:MAG: hypothetical protein NC347_12550 [Clostridium sp.]|nr:hypothetical protein [Clostridium sp.]MCM1181082.1 hypothetical protein [Clostridium sp.]